VKTKGKRSAGIFNTGVGKLEKRAIYYLATSDRRDSPADAKRLGERRGGEPVLLERPIRKKKKKLRHLFHGKKRLFQ